MSRIRTIKPSFFLDDKLAKLPPLTRLLFIGLWTLADREGRLEDRWKQIRAQILPYDRGDTNAMLQILHDHGYITRYSVDEVALIEIHNFTKHQRITGKEAETPSEFPPRQGVTSNGETMGKQWGNNGETAVAQEGKGMEGNGIGREWKGKGMEGESSTDAPAPETIDLQVIAQDWQPGAQALAILNQKGIPESFTRQCIPEFVLYWSERQEKRAGFDAAFVNNVLWCWQHQAIKPGAPIPGSINGRRQGQTRIERMLEQHAEFYASQKTAPADDAPALTMETGNVH